MHALTLAAVGVRCFIVAFAGGLLGLVLGDILLPILLLAGSNPAAVGGATTSVSRLAAAAGSIGHVHAGRRRRSSEGLLPETGVILPISGTITIVRGVV